MSTVYSICIGCGELIRSDSEDGTRLSDLEHHVNCSCQEIHAVSLTGSGAYGEIQRILRKMAGKTAGPLNEEGGDFYAQGRRDPPPSNEDRGNPGRLPMLDFFGFFQSPTYKALKFARNELYWQCTEPGEGEKKKEDARLLQEAREAKYGKDESGHG